ncbi:MAG: hypothetical protein Q4G10_04655 [Bacteroidia bacterium]|nr:hypothetical protein [Bacteroidia bacterium]
MKRIITIAAFLTAVLTPAASGQSLKQVEGSFLEPLQKRDSILVADQIKYGFTLEGVEEGTGINLQDYSGAFGDTLIVVRNWKVDTLAVKQPKKNSGGSNTYDIRADVVISPFEAGHYTLPEIALQRTLADGTVDTLLFNPQEMQVCTMPVDTTTYVPHDIKGQMRYPLTAKELIPYLAGLWMFAVLAILIGALIMMRRKKGDTAEVRKDPAYIVALRKLDKFRGDKFWAPEKQKTFYSGLTDTLREYIADTFGIDACEMTTAEIFDALKGNENLTPELYSEAKELFETADFVKFAKHLADDEDNAKALPAAVRFVTSTYQSALEQEKPEEDDKKQEEAG